MGQIFAPPPWEKYEKFSQHARHIVKHSGYHSYMHTHQQQTTQYHEREVATEVVSLVLGSRLLVQFGEKIGGGGETGPV